MDLKVWNRTKGLAKTVGCGIGCAAASAFYIPFVAGAALFVGVAGAATNSSEAFTAAVAIAASPALFLGEAALGVGQFVSGKEMSLTYMNGGNSVFKPDDTAAKRASPPVQLNSNAKVKSPERAPSTSLKAKTSSIDLAVSSKAKTSSIDLAASPKAKTSSIDLAASSKAKTPSADRSSVARQISASPKVEKYIAKQSVDTAQVEILKKTEKDLGKAIRQDRVERMKELLKGNVLAFMSGQKRQELLAQQISIKKTIHKNSGRGGR